MLCLNKGARWGMPSTVRHTQQGLRDARDGAAQSMCNWWRHCTRLDRKRASRCVVIRCCAHRNHLHRVVVHYLRAAVVTTK